MKIADELFRALSVCLLLLALSANPIAAQDRAKVSPTLYSVTWENAVMRVLHQKMRPGERDQTHDQPTMAAYHLTDGRLLLSLASGATSQREFTAGTAAWIESQRAIVSENIGSAELQLLSIEIKKRTLNPDWRLNSQDPTRVNTEYYKVLLENRRLRVILATFPAGSADKLSAWPGMLFYPLSEGTLEVTPAGGKSQVFACAPHKPRWQKFQRLTVRNPGETEMKLLLVEIK